MSSDPTGWATGPASIRCWATTIALNRSPDARMALWMDWSFGRWDRWSRLASNPERTALNIPAKGPEGMVGQNLRCWLLGHERCDAHIDRRLRTAPDGPSHPIVLRPRPVVRWVRCVPSPRSVRGPRHYGDMSLRICARPSGSRAPTSHQSKIRDDEACDGFDHGNGVERTGS